MEFELRPRSMTGLHAMFAAIGLIFGRCALKPNAHIVEKVLFGIFLAMGLWCLILFLKDIAVWLVLKYFGAEVVTAEIAAVSQGISFHSEKDGSETSIFKVCCREGSRVYKAKTMRYLDYQSIGMTVPVYVSYKFPRVYQIDFFRISPPVETTPSPAGAENAPEPEEAPDPLPVRRPSFKWIYSKEVLTLLLIAVPITAFCVFVYSGNREAWPLLIPLLAAVVMLAFAVWRIARYTVTFVLGDRLSARIDSISRDKKGKYIISLSWRDWVFYGKTDYLGKGRIGERINVYVCRWNPDLYEVDL